MKVEKAVMFDEDAVDAELARSLGLSLKQVKQLIAVGGDSPNGGSWNAAGVCGRLTERNW